MDKFQDILDMTSETETEVYRPIEKKLNNVKRSLMEENIKINSDDVEALANFIILWTDSYPDGDTHNHSQGDNEYKLCGRKIIISEECPDCELIGLISKIPFDDLIDDCNIIHFEHIMEIFKSAIDKGKISHIDNVSIEELTCRLLVIGEHYNIWKLIDPFDSLTKLSEENKFYVASVLWPYIIINIGYIKYVSELISSVGFSEK